MKRTPAPGLMAQGSAPIPLGPGDGVWADLKGSGLLTVLVGSGLLTGLSVCEPLVVNSDTGLLADLTGSRLLVDLIDSGLCTFLDGSGLRTGLEVCEVFVVEPNC